MGDSGERDPIVCAELLRQSGDLRSSLGLRLFRDGYVKVKDSCLALDS